MEEGRIRQQFVKDAWTLTIVYLAMLGLAIFPVGERLGSYPSNAKEEQHPNGMGLLHRNIVYKGLANEQMDSVGVLNLNQIAP